MSENEAQVRAIEQGALLRAMPKRATLAVTGDDRQSWLAAMLTADIASLKVGQGCYALSVTKNGRIQADVWVVNDQDRFLLGVLGDLADGLCEAMNHYLIMEDAELERCAVQHAWWLACGPRSEAVADAAKSAGALTALGALGELDIAIIAAASTAAPNIGETFSSVEGALMATPGGWERIRIERMLPRFGVDYQVASYPQEACLENLAVSFNKGCYLGQEAVFKLEQRGHVSKRLVRLVLDGETAIEAGTEIMTPQGEAVGKVTSATAADGKTWALGMVRYKQTLSGTELKVADKPAKVSCLAVREDKSC